MRPVLAANSWPTNGHLITECVRLGYLKPTDHVLDPTGSKQAWWKVWRPDRLTVLNTAADGTDFRTLDYPDRTFDTIAYDPAYVATGGRETSTIKGMHDRYGMNGPETHTPEQVQAQIDEGLTEMVRVVKPARTKRDGGIILVKCKSYIWSGSFWPGAHYTWQHAMLLGLVQVDEFHHVGSPGPQPKRTRADGRPAVQQHARQNVSTLLVLRKPR